MKRLLFIIIMATVIMMPVVFGEQEIIQPENGSIIEVEDLKIKWSDTGQSDYYLLTLTDKTANEVLLDKHYQSNQSYVFQHNVLTVDHTYEITVAFSKDQDIKSVTSSFTVEDDVYIVKPTLYNARVYKTVLKDLYFGWEPDVSADYYTVEMKNLTDKTTLVDGVTVSDNEYKVKESSLVENNEYSFKVTTVKGAYKRSDEIIVYIIDQAFEQAMNVTADVSNNFNMTDPEVTNIENRQVIPYESIDMKWKSTSRSDYYLVSLVDTSLDQVVLDEKIKQSHIKINKSLLKPGHSYAFYTTVYKDRRITKDKTIFTVADIDSTSFSFLESRLTYHKDDVNFKWSPVKDVETYVLSLQNITTGEWVIDAKETIYSSYSLPVGLLQTDTSYKVYLTAKGFSLEAAIEHEFTTQSQISQWAKPYVDAVYTKKVLKDTLYKDLLMNPQESLTRLEFCEMLMALYDKSDTHKAAVDLTLAKEFKDIAHLSDEQKALVLKANALGIISGKSHAYFDPDGLVTRQEMAVMLKHVYDLVKGVYKPGHNSHDFQDKHKISTWAKEGVVFAHQMGILEGDGVNFKPTDLASHEMGFVLLEKALNVFSD